MEQKINKKSKQYKKNSFPDETNQNKHTHKKIIP